MVYFSIILAPSGVKLGYFKGAKAKRGENSTKKQGFIVRKSSEYGTFYGKLGKLANNVRALLEDNHAFMWVIGEKN